MKIALLTCDNMSDFVSDEELLIQELRRHGVQADLVPWNRPNVVWSDYKAAVIRTTWDYTEHLEPFLRTLSVIQRTVPFFANDLSLVRWNCDKRYLLDLQNGGVPVIPLVSLTSDHLANLDECFSKFRTEEIIIKPFVSANAKDTYRLKQSEKSTWPLEDIVRLLREKPLMCQPFVSTVLDPGEFSLIFIDGELSHTILKTPKAHDFRVQEEHGGLIRSVPSTPAMEAFGLSVLQAAVKSSASKHAPFYGRVDILRASSSADQAGVDENWLLMELELVEPSLYFRYESTSAPRFAAALMKRLGTGLV